MKTLEQQITELTNEHNFKNECAEKLNGIKALYFISDNKKRICVEALNVKEFNKVLNLYHPTNNNTVIGTATDKYYKDLNTPFKVGINNPCSPNQWNNFKMNFEYTSNDINIQISLPINLFEKFTSTSTRKITDSEYHYFTGVSQRDLYNMTVRCYNFKSDNYSVNEQINWYGGDKTCVNESLINSITDFLTTA